MLKMILVFAIYYSTALVVTAKSLEERVEVLEELVMDLEYKIVREYGLVKRCQLQQVDNGISVCRFEGIYMSREQIFQEGFDIRFETRSRMQSCV